MKYMPLVTGITIIYPLIMLKTDSMVDRDLMTRTAYLLYCSQR